MDQVDAWPVANAVTLDRDALLGQSLLLDPRSRVLHVYSRRSQNAKDREAAQVHGELRVCACLRFGPERRRKWFEGGGLPIDCFGWVSTVFASNASARHLTAQIEKRRPYFPAN